MIEALRYEWVRIRTIRSTIWLSVIALVFGITLSFLVAMGTSFSFDAGSGPAGGALAGIGTGVVTQFATMGLPYLLSYILAMIGVFAGCDEYRHGTSAAAMTAPNSRISSLV